MGRQSQPTTSKGPPRPTGIRGTNNARTPRRGGHAASRITASGTGASAPPLKLVPIAPERFQRYTRRRTIISKRNADYIVPPLCRSFSSEPLPQWTAERHPEGCLYFVHEQHRIFTDAYLYDTTVFAQITSVVGQLLARTEVRDLLAADSSHVDIVLDLMTESPDNDKCGYYFVDHSARVVFWVDDFSMSALDNWIQIPGIDAPSHVKMCLEIEYWSVRRYGFPQTSNGHRVHCEYFPTATPISPKIVDELRAAIVYGIGDAMSSPQTTQPFPIERLSRMLTLTKEMICEPAPGTGKSTRFKIKMDPGLAAVFARFMHDFALNRFFNFHGEKTPRLNSDESVYGSTPKRSHTFAWLSALLLFNSPFHYLRTLQAVNMDQLIKYASWQRFITALRAEWLDLVLYGTLILNTNVGFLSTPASGGSTAGQVASYASICFGVTSIILGILLLRQYQVESPDVPDVTRAAQLFCDHTSSPHGLEMWAIVLSLPFALTIWAMITFILAFLITIFETGSAKVRWIIFATLLAVWLVTAGFVWTQKRFAWIKTLTETKTKIKASASPMWRSWLAWYPGGWLAWRPGGRPGIQASP
ncbi:hypothetical protein K438DRAFT_2023317 [Mycena galopus ATCC 62051]|nr:hypothetical protein K438DRAFT_2023317 [Mycena galopus ATCC 62051]